MKIRIKVAVVVAMVMISGFVVLRPATVAASTGPSPIAIDGVVYDKNHQPVTGAVVVAWCGGIDFFGGSDTTDANGHYLIKTDSEACPFDNELTVTTDVDNDGGSDGARHTQVHTKTTINIYLGEYTSVAVPEYGWISGGVAAAAGAGAISFVRRGQAGKLGL